MPPDFRPSYITLMPSPPCAWGNDDLQIKSYDADLVEAQGYKSAISVADELRCEQCTITRPLTKHLMMVHK